MPLEFPAALAHPVGMDGNCSATRYARLQSWLSGHWVLLAIVLACALVEAVLQGADHGLWGALRWRALAYEYGGFWRGLLGSWQSNYMGQPVAMFASYGFLHSGFLHLVVNMITLVSLGQIVIERVGQLRFTLIYAGALLGGAVGFALLSSAVQPMVGASGALFGLAGGVVGWEYTIRRADREGLGPVLRVIVLLVALNLVMYWAMDGSLAWETHLGGFGAGWVASWWIRQQAAN